MRKRRIPALLAVLILAISLFTAGCGTEIDSIANTITQDTVSDTSDTEGTAETQTQENTSDSDSSDASAISLGEIPDYSGDIYIAINGNIPYFTEDDYTTEAFETYSDLDSLGRCGVAYANICQELMPTEDRESISSVYPSGWVQNAYDFVDGGYLYNRCHLIGFQLAGENANELNLITGTRTFNTEEGMLSFENMVADYVKETDNHVLYRVTPMFEGDNLVASGVLMEAWSVEDEGDGICFCVYVYNVEPGVTIDYATGENWKSGTSQTGTGETAGSSSDTASDEEGTYVLNTNTMRFHKPDCSSVSDMNEQNRQEYTGSREELIEEGYIPCGNCNP